MQQSKTCRICGNDCPIGEFALRQSPPHRPGSRRNECRACKTAADRVRRGRPTPGDIVTRECVCCFKSFDQVARGKRMATVCPGCTLERGREAARTSMKRKNILKYGITLEQFADRLAAQGGRCAICGASEPGGQGRWVIDHDHGCCASKQSCGECVRGLLCNACNVGIGMLKDDSELLRRAADYIESHRR